MSRLAKSEAGYDAHFVRYISTCLEAEQASALERLPIKQREPGGASGRSDAGSNGSHIYLRRSKQSAHMDKQFAMAIGLSDEMADIGHLRIIGLRPAGCDDETDMGPTLIHTSGEFQTVESAGHVYIREQQPNVGPGFQNSESAFGIRGFSYGKAVSLQGVGHPETHERFIIDDQDKRLWISHSHGNADNGFWFREFRRERALASEFGARLSPKAWLLSN